MYNSLLNSCPKDTAGKSLISHSSLSVSGLSDSKLNAATLKKTKSKDDLQLEPCSSLCGAPLEAKPSRISLAVCHTTGLHGFASSSNLTLEHISKFSESPRIVDSPIILSNQNSSSTDVPLSYDSESISSKCPPEILAKIFSYFQNSPADLATCCLVNRYWGRIATQRLWNRPLLYSFSSLTKLTTIVRSTKDSRPYPIRQLDLTLLDEVHRNSHFLSTQLAKLIPAIGGTLYELDLGFCKGLKNYDLQRVLPSLINLNCLNLAGGNRSDIVLTKLVKHCPGLTRLSLSWNAQLTDFGFIELARQCPKLQYLDLTNCAQLTDNAVVALANYCGRLRALSLSYCQCVTDDAVMVLLQRCSSLTVINVWGCSGVSKEFKDRVTKKFPTVSFNISGLLPFYFRPPPVRQLV